MNNEAKSVTRYVATYVNRDGMRTLMRAAQGRNTFATEAEAQAWLEAVTRNNSAAAIEQAWGSNPRFDVRPCPCWPNHFDPQTIWFGSATATSRTGQDKRARRRSAMLARLAR